MSDDFDYLDFRDEVLIGIADVQEPPGLGEVDIIVLVEGLKIPAQESWLMLVSKDLEEQGFGQDRSTMKSRRFLINGNGLARATELRRNRRKPSNEVANPVSTDWSKWGAILTGTGILVAILIAVAA